MANIQVDSRALANVCRKHRIQRLSFFGSVLRDDFGPGSDLDILIVFEPGTRVGLRFFAIERELAALLGRNVDLNTPGFLGDRILEHVMAEAEVQYEAA